MLCNGYGFYGALGYVSGGLSKMAYHGADTPENPPIIAR